MTLVVKDCSEHKTGLMNYQYEYKNALKLFPNLACKKVRRQQNLYENNEIYSADSNRN